MADLQYHLVYPEANNTNDGFVQFNSVDFILLADGRKMVKNSVVVEYDLEVFSTGATPVVIGDMIGLENKIGGHSFMESWSCEVQSVGNIEQINEYPRWVNMIASASKDQNDFMSAFSQAEGRQLREAGGRYVCQPVASNSSQGATIKTSANFSIKPQVCFNNMTGDDYSFSKNGYAKISFNCARNSNALFGSGATASNYKLKNVVLRFMSVEDDNKQGAMLMNSVSSLKQTINSQQANILSRVPSDKVNGVVISFLEQAHETNATDNSYALEQLPQLDEVQYLFSDSTARYITYTMDDYDDMILKGIEALSESGVNMCHSSKLSANKGTIIGLAFSEYIDLRSQKFSVQLKNSSAGISSNPRLVYLFFSTLIQL